LNILWTLRDHW